MVSLGEKFYSNSPTIGRDADGRAVPTRTSLTPPKKAETQTPAETTQPPVAAETKKD